MARVSCLGVLVVDALSGPLAHYPVPRVRTQSVTERIRFAAGGGMANTSSALGRMGFGVSAFSKVGGDLLGSFLIQELRACGVDTTSIRISTGETIPFTFVGIHPNGDRTFIHTPGTNKTFLAEDLDTERLFQAEYLLYQDLWVLPRLDGAPGAALLAEARRRGVVTRLDECWGLGPDRKPFETMLPHCDYVLPSLDDMKAIYPGMSADAIAAHILTFGVKAIGLKMGVEGCWVVSPKEQCRIPAFPAQVVDVTGAGDCWDAGFIAGLMQGESLQMSAYLGNACAAFCIESVGGAAGVPHYAAVQRRVKQHTARKLPRTLPSRTWKRRSLTSKFS